ncbi:hypothetical protein NL676_006666 [Syzygium grande]|nr:hypothetical protein NL676_006666 [Syzygium grande]
MLRRRFIQGLAAICCSANSLIPPIPHSLHGSSFMAYSSHGPTEDAERLPKDVVLLMCPSSANGGVCHIYVDFKKRPVTILPLWPSSAVLILRASKKFVASLMVKQIEQKQKKQRAGKLDLRFRLRILILSRYGCRGY